MIFETAFEELLANEFSKYRKPAIEFRKTQKKCM